MRHYHITASNFGAILRRKSDTAPDSLVLCIIQPKNISTAAIQYGIKNEQIALKEYVAYQQMHSHPHLSVSPTRFYINKGCPFLGVSPDGAVYDLSNMQQPFGFLEIKYPYSHKDSLPAEVCGLSTVCCELNASTGNIKL